MKCIVCGRNYEAAECPRCRFPDVQIPTDAPATLLQSLKQDADNYRREFLPKVQVQIAICFWKDQNGNVVEDREELLDLGSADGLAKAEVWLEQKFARIPDVKELPLAVRISANGDTWEKNLSVPNLHEPELQQIGAAMDGDCNLKLMLRNNTEQPTASAPVALFE